MKKAYRLVEVEEIIGEMDFSEVADDVMESEEDYQIVISGWWVQIPELGLNLHEGVFCNYDEAEQMYLPDCAISIVAEAGEETKEGDWLYYEQDGFVLTLANFLRGKMDMERIEQLSCFICLPETEADSDE